MNIHELVPSLRRIAGLGMGLAASMTLAQAAAAASVTRVFVVVVPPAEEQAFNHGIRNWDKCLHDHGSKQTALAYSAVTGDLDRYLFLDEYSAWAEMDARDPAGKACEPVFVSGVLPNVSRAFSEIAVLNAKDTYMPGGDPDPAPMLWVVAYRIKPGQRQVLDDALAKFAAAAARVHWEGHFAGYDIQGSGQGAENFVLVWPNKSWADVGRPTKPSDKEMMESVYGKRAAGANLKRLLGAVAESWSEGWSYQGALSYIPGK